MRRFLPLLLALSALALTFAVYLPGLSGTFVFDDWVNITSNDSLRLKVLDLAGLKAAALSGNAGIFGRPLSMVSFAIDHWISGTFDVGAMKATNVLIHLATGIAVFAFTSLILRAHQRQLGQRNSAAVWISLAVASAWLLHPLNLTSVLYVVQRMTSLSALFCLLGLASYLWGRLRVANQADRLGWAAIAASFVLFTPLAALSKESGALLPLFLLLTELAFFKFQAHSIFSSRMLKLVFIVTIALPALVVLGYTFYSHAWITASYKMRTFTMGERLLTETRVLWLYLRLIFVPDLFTMGLYHDDVAISKTLLNPITTLTSSLGLIALIAVAVAAWAKHRLLAYGIAFFLLGHSMESTILALEIMHEHRNYLPMTGLLLPLFYYLISASRFIDHNASRVGAVTAIVALFATVTATRATHWGDPVDMLVKEVEHHPDSTRANLALANFYTATPARSDEEASMWYGNAYRHYVRAAELSPHDPIGLFGLIGLQLRANQEIEPSWPAVIEGRIRNNPLAPSTVTAVMKLENCFTDKVCKFDPAIMEGILRAALDNPAPQPFARTQLLFSYSNFLLLEKNDIEGALKAAYAATAASPPELTSQEALVTIMIKAKRYDEAETALDRLRRLDNLQLKTSRTAELAGIIETARANAGRSAPLSSKGQ